MIPRSLQRLAAIHLGFETLETRRADHLDFREVSVWGVREALLAAYEAGRKAELRRPVNLSELLIRRRQIALIWSIEDVLEVRPDLRPHQAWQVLLAVQASHDANLGVTWEVVKFHAEELFGPAPEPDTEEVRP